jgi:hypothetical protein
MRITGFLTNTAPGGPGRQLADLELRHRRHARVEDRIRAAKDTGLRKLPFHDMNQNRIWVAISALAQDLLACCARLALPAQAAGYEPKRLRLRILAVAGRIVRTARHHLLHIDPNWPWADLITTGHTRLAAPLPDHHHQPQRPGTPEHRPTARPGITPAHPDNNALNPIRSRSQDHSTGVSKDRG